MKILVCIKQVPDMESKFTLQERWYDTHDLAWRLNEYDEYAIEQAVAVKEQLGDSDLTVLSIGPARVKEAMKKALAMGCDRGLHIEDNEVEQRDPQQIAALIAAHARDNHYDLIFCGMQSQDRASAQVGVITAEKLGFPCVTTIVDFHLQDGSITVKRELEGGLKARVSLSPPALFTCQLGLNTPRYPTLPNIMKAKKKEMITVPAAEISQEAAVQETMDIYFPEKKGGGLILEGDAGELADRLLRILKEQTTVMG